MQSFSFDPKNIDFSLYTNYAYADNVEKLLGLSLVRILSKISEGLFSDKDLAFTGGNNPDYDFSIKNTKFELKCSKKTYITLELARGDQGNPLLFSDLQKSLLTETKADYYIFINPGFSNTFQGQPIRHPITNKSGRNLFKIRVIPTSWLIQDIKLNREIIMREYQSRLTKNSKAFDLWYIKDQTNSPYKLHYYEKNSKGPGAWVVGVDPVGYNNFKLNDGWVGYIGTKEEEENNYIADFSSIHWQWRELKNLQAFWGSN